MTDVRVLGVRVSSLTMDETLAWAELVIRAREPTQHVVVNAAKIVEMHRDPRLRGVVNGCPVVNVDGQSVVWAARLLGVAVPERVTGIDFMERLLERGGHRVFLLGAERETVASLAESVGRTVEVAGIHHGYWPPDDDDHVVAQVAASNADILFVALPSPRKEFWIAERLARLNVPLVVGVGGSFDVLAGKRRRAPRRVQSLGLEWLFRVSQEPRRLMPRYAHTNSVFVCLVFRALVDRLIHRCKFRKSGSSRT